MLIFEIRIKGRVNHTRVVFQSQVSIGSISSKYIMEFINRELLNKEVSLFVSSESLEPRKPGENY